MNQDIREAVRFLTANPGVAVIVILTLGLAIGVNSTILVAEVALALMLLVSAGLLVRSFVRLTAIDPGYGTTGIVATHV